MPQNSEQQKFLVVRWQCKDCRERALLHAVDVNSYVHYPFMNSLPTKTKPKKTIPQPEELCQAETLFRKSSRILYAFSASSKIEVSTTK